MGVVFWMCGGAQRKDFKSSRLIAGPQGAAGGRNRLHSGRSARGKGKRGAGDGCHLCKQHSAFSVKSAKMSCDED